MLKSSIILVSIIITYIDEHDFLEEAIKSALAQVGIDIELIVVCNAPKISSGYNPGPEHQSTFKFIHEPTPGSAYARNAGLHAATGDWIQFLDVDDLIMPLKIAHQVMHAGADAVVSPHMYQYTSGKEQPSKWTPEDVWIGILDSGLGSTSSMVWKRKALADAGGWNTAYQSHQEYELLFRMISRGDSIIIDDHRETIVRERISGSLTQQTKTFRAEQGIQLREDIWEFLTSNKMASPFRQDAFRQFIFKQLRATYRRNPESTAILYKKYFQQGGFTPKNVGLPFYPLLYKSLGFTATENLFHFYSKMRDNYLPFLPHNK